MNHKLLAPCAISILILTACGQNDSQLATEATPEPTPEESPEPTEEEQEPDLPSDGEIQEYVEAIASGDVGDLNDAVDLTIEKSPAADYLRYFTHQVNAQIDAGLRNPADERVNQVEEGFEICTSLNGEETCNAYTHFTGEAGAIYGFEVEGTAVEDRLLMGSGEPVEGPRGSSVELVAAYLNAAGTHTVIGYEFRSGDVSMSMPWPSFRSPEGRQSQAEDHLGTLHLAADSMSHYAAWFPVSELGGELHVEIIDEEGYHRDELTVPIE